MSQLIKTYTFVPDTPIESAKANKNFDDIVNYINANVIVKDASLGFDSVPYGPDGVNPTSNNHLVRKAYVDGILGYTGINPTYTTSATVKSAIKAVDDELTSYKTSNNTAVTQRVKTHAVGGALNGTPPAVATGQFLYAAGTTVLTTDSNGEGTVSFGTAFPNGLITVVASPGDVNVDFAGITVMTSGTNKSGFKFRAWNALAQNDYVPSAPTLNRLRSIQIRVNWIAFGW